jgi:hypothetical protein
MEIQELYFTNENGQVEINWESLELLTSAEFVENIKFDLSDWSTFGNCPMDKIFTVRVSNNYVNVVLVHWQGAYVSTYTFNLKENTFQFDRISAPVIELATEALKWVTK